LSKRVKSVEGGWLSITSAREDSDVWADVGERRVRSVVNAYETSGCLAFATTVNSAAVYQVVGM
jgi:hypothetical protein